MGDVYESLLTQGEGQELYIINKNFSGQTYEWARTQFAKATVVGILTPGTRTGVQLNPPDSAVLGETDKLIVLASSGFVSQRPYKTTLPEYL